MHMDDKKIQMINAEEVYDIMNNFVGINDSIESLMILLNVAEIAYRYEYNRENQATLRVINEHLEMVFKDMQKEIENLDNLILYAED